MSPDQSYSHPAHKYYLNHFNNAAPSSQQQNTYKNPRDYTNHQNVIIPPVEIKKEEPIPLEPECKILTDHSNMADLDNIEPSIQSSSNLPSTSSKTYQTYLRPKNEMEDAAQIQQNTHTHRANTAEGANSKLFKASPVNESETSNKTSEQFPTKVPIDLEATLSNAVYM